MSVRVSVLMCMPGPWLGCGLDTVTGELLRRRVSPMFQGVSDWLAELPAPVAVAYEAGPTGFGLARQLTAAGIR